MEQKITSPYENYEYISAQPLFAAVREELKSYFNTGMVDDLMFPIWTGKCLRKLSNAVYKKEEILLFLEDFQAKLPPDFKSVREAWLCVTLDGIIYQSPNSYYKKITTRVSDDYVVQEDSCPPPCDPCPIIIESIYKTTTQTPIPGFRTLYLLKPGNLSAIRNCSDDCRNIGVTSSPETFDIRDNKFVTNFRSGTVYMVYYSNQEDEEGTVMIPDIIRIQEAIEAYIKYKIFEQIWNSVTDETFNQVERKYQVYLQKYNEAFIAAENEIIKKSTLRRIDDIKRQRQRLNKYDIK